VSFPRPEVDIRSSPRSFDELIDWLDCWSYRLVLLEEYPLSEVRAALLAVSHAVSTHRLSAEGWIARLTTTDPAVARGVELLQSDHERFETSLEQLWWFFRAVEKEDHGGHRQALGQYGRVLAEALRRHRADERRLEARSSRLDMEPVP
jgi:hypothetical protein